MKKYCLFAQTLIITDIALASSTINDLNDSVALNTTQIIQQEPHYSIIETSSLAYVEKYVKVCIDNQLIGDIYDKNISDRSYFIFDIDNTLLHITIANLSAKYFDNSCPVFEKYRKNNNYDEKRMDKIHRTIHEKSPEILVDNGAPAFIKKLQASGIKTLAISAIHNFEFDGAKLLDLRCNKLKKFGIDFSKTYPNLQPCCINKKFDMHHSSGIISSASNKKGLALTKFFNFYAKIGNNMKVPRQIIFLDDVLYNVLTIGDFCKVNRVNYIGVHYTACNDLKFVAPYNATTLYYQIMIADKKSLIVNDDKVVDYIDKLFSKPIISIKHRIFQEILKKLKSKIETTVAIEPNKVEPNETDNPK